MSATPSAQLPFERLGDYEVLAPISEGGMASVWLGRAIEPPQRVVALKVIRPEHGRNHEFVSMFLDEARIASRLSHPNIVRLYGLGHDGKRHFLVMEVLRGMSLLALWEAARRIAFRLEGRTGLRDTLIGTAFILAPQLEPEPLGRDIGTLNHRFFSGVYGS